MKLTFRLTNYWLFGGLDCCFAITFIGCVCVLCCGLACWCVASEPKSCGLEETPPTRRIAVPQGTSREVWQRSRNETSTWTWL